MRLRLDRVLVELGFFESRNKAMEAILNREIIVDSKIVMKASQKVSLNAKIELKEMSRYVSRSAYKLKHYLDKNSIELKDRDALDIGSSTGGFTQVMLEKGVKSVDAVDIGHNQLHHFIKEDSRVSMFEGMDIRNFYPNKSYDLIVSDISFISLSLVLNDIDRLSKLESDIILLFKPQFEVGKSAKRDSRGVVIDNWAIESAMKRFQNESQEFDWRLIRVEPSLQKGKKGNQEYIYHFKKV